MPIKESLDSALLQEIEQLKLVNQQQEKKYVDIIESYKQDNCELQARLEELDSAVERSQVDQAREFRDKCEDWQGIVDSLGRMTENEETTKKFSEQKRVWQAKLNEQENSFLQASE